MSTVTPVPGLAPPTSNPVFRTAMAELNKMRPRSSKSYAEDPRFFASGLAKCYRQQVYWITGAEGEPSDDRAHHTFETGKMWEEQMDQYLDHLEANDPRVDRVVKEARDGDEGNPTGFRFTTKQGVTISGRADFIIYWNEHPDSGKPEVEVGDFKTEGEFGFSRLFNGTETTKASHRLQVHAGTVGIPHATYWRVVYLHKTLPYGWKIQKAVDEGRHQLDWAVLEFAYPKEVGLDDLKEELVNLAWIVSEVEAGRGDQIPRWVPLTGMGSAITHWASNGKGIFKDEDGVEQEYWACAGYCPFEESCKAEARAEAEQLNDWKASTAEGSTPLAAVPDEREQMATEMAQEADEAERSPKPLVKHVPFMDIMKLKDVSLSALEECANAMGEYYMSQEGAHDPRRELTDEELERRAALKDKAMSLFEKERDAMRAAMLADTCLWCSEPSPDSDYCTPEHAVAALADKAGYDVCLGSEERPDCGRPIARGLIVCGLCSGEMEWTPANA